MINYRIRKDNNLIHITKETKLLISKSCYSSLAKALTRIDDKKLIALLNHITDEDLVNWGISEEKKLIISFSDNKNCTVSLKDGEYVCIRVNFPEDSAERIIISIRNFLKVVTNES